MAFWALLVLAGINHIWSMNIEILQEHSKVLIIVAILSIPFQIIYAYIKYYKTNPTYKRPKYIFKLIKNLVNIENDAEEEKMCITERIEVNELINRIAFERLNSPEKGKNYAGLSQLRMILKETDAYNRQNIFIKLLESLEIHKDLDFKLAILKEVCKMFHGLSQEDIEIITGNNIANTKK